MYWIYFALVLRCILGIREVFLFTNTYSVVKRFLTDQHLKPLNSNSENVSNGYETRRSVNFKNSLPLHNRSLACIPTDALAAMRNVAKKSTHTYSNFCQPACRHVRTLRVEYYQQAKIIL